MNNILWVIGFDCSDNHSRIYTKNDSFNNMLYKLADSGLFNIHVAVFSMKHKEVEFVNKNNVSFSFHGSYFSIFELINKIKPKLINLWGFRMDINRYIISKYPNIAKTIYFVGGDVSRCPEANTVKKIYVSVDKQKELLVNNGINSNKVDLCPFGVNQKLFPLKSYDNNEKYDLVYSSDWREVKRQHLLLEALSIIDRKLNVAFIGDINNGYYKKWLPYLSKLKKKHNITVFNRMSQNEMVNILLDSKVSLLLSSSEGGSRMLLEYMSCGLPVIVTKDCLSNSSIIDDRVSGIICDCSAAFVSNAIFNLLFDYNKIKHYGLNAHNEVKNNFYYDKMYEIQLSNLLEIVGIKKNTFGLYGFFGAGAYADDLIGVSTVNLFNNSKEINMLNVTGDKNIHLYNNTIFAGGSLLGKLRLPPFNKIKNWYRTYKGNLYILGTGWREENTINSNDIKDINLLFDKSDFVGVRGNLSISYMKNHGVNLDKVNVIGDAGFCYSPSEYYINNSKSFIKDKNKLNVGIVLRTLSDIEKDQDSYSVDNDVVYANFASVIEHIIKNKNADIYFIPFSSENKCDGSDISAINNVIGRIDKSLSNRMFVYNSNNYNLNGALLGHMDFVISHRLHGSILSIAQSVPVLPLEYQFHKMEDSLSIPEFNHLRKYILNIKDLSIDKFEERFDVLNSQPIKNMNNIAVNIVKNRYNNIIDKFLYKKDINDDIYIDHDNLLCYYIYKNLIPQKGSVNLVKDEFLCDIKMKTENYIDKTLFVYENKKYECDGHIGFCYTPKVSENIIDTTLNSYNIKDNSILVDSRDISGNLIDELSKDYNVYIANSDIKYLNAIHIDANEVILASIVNKMKFVISDDDYVIATALAQGCKVVPVNSSELLNKFEHIDSIDELTIDNIYNSLEKQNDAYLNKTINIVDNIRKCYIKCFNKLFTNREIVKARNILYSNIKNNSTNKKKVLFIYNDLGIAGAEKITLDIIKSLNKSKIFPVVFVDRDNVGENYDIILNEFKRLKVPVIYRKDYFNGMADEEISDLFSMFDIIHYNYWGNSSLIPAVNLAKMKNNNLFTILVYHTSNKSIIKYNSSFDLQVTVNPDKDNNITNNILFIPNGVRNEPKYTLTKSQVRKKYGISETDKVIVSVGHVGSNKNYKEILLAVNKLNNKSNIKVVIVGATNFDWGISAKAELDYFINKNHLKRNVIFTGVLDNVDNIIQIADMCIHPSHSEAFSVAMLEYMLNRKVVIIPRRIVNDVYNDNNCLVYDNIKSLTKTIEDIKDNVNNYYKKIIEGFNMTRIFSKENVFSLYEKLYLDPNSFIKYYKIYLPEEFINKFKTNAKNDNVVFSKSNILSVNQINSLPVCKKYFGEPIKVCDNIIEYEYFILNFSDKKIFSHKFIFNMTCNVYEFVKVSDNEWNVPMPIFNIISVNNNVNNNIGIYIDRLSNLDSNFICRAMGTCKKDIRNSNIYINCFSNDLAKLSKKYSLSEYFKFNSSLETIINNCNTLIVHSCKNELFLSSLLSLGKDGTNIAINKRLLSNSSYIDNSNVLLYITAIDLIRIVQNDFPSNNTLNLKSICNKYTPNLIFNKIKEIIN